LRTIPIVKLLIVFAVAFSLASLTGPMASHFILPGISPANAIAQTPCHVSTGGGGCSDYWVPAGSAEDTFVATIFTDEQSEFTNIQSASPSIDMTDWPLTPALTPTFTSSSSFQITSIISAAGNYEIQFMLANNFWGVNMNYGNDPNGVQIRQGIWHMIDTASFANSEPSLSGQAVALDSPNPTDNVGGLPAANPCGWDKAFPETGTNCIVGAPGGTAYHLGSAAGAGGFVWNQAPGSADMNAAAQHFVNAGIATGFNPSTSQLTGISAAAGAHQVNFFIRNDNPPRLDFGNSLAEQICWLFTGSYSVPCAPYLSVTRGPITAFPGFTTSTTSVNLSWGMYTAAYGSTTGPLPFDSTFYFTYNSQFVSGISSIQSPSGPCSTLSVPTVSAANYVYLCNPSYDSYTNQMEFAKCLTVTGDPVVGSTSNNSTGTCSGGGLSAIGAGLEAENQFGANAYTVEVFEQNEQFGLLNNGWIRVVNNVGAGLPNFWTWLNAWNSAPAVPGTIRQGFKQSTSSVSPFIDSTVWDAYIVGNIYDSLTVTNPLSGGQLMDWMVLSIQQLPNSSLTYTPPSQTTQTFRFTLRSDLFFQDGKKVTSFDVAFSYLALKGTGAFAGGGAAPMTGVTILGPSQFDINVNSVGPFTLLTVSGLPIMPGAYWSNAGSSAWTSAISTCTASNAPCYPAQYTIGTPSTTTVCALTCVFPASDMNVNVAQTSASYDPISTHTLVGSGAYTCGVVGSGGSGSCSSTGTQNPPAGGSYVLSRFGKGLAPASSVSGIYFRSNGNLAAYLWSQDTGDITHDFLNFSVVASCFGAPVTSTGPCAHFQQGIGANGGPVSVGLSQVAIVNRFVGLNWIAPFNWAVSPPLGIVPLNPVLYENTVTLSPASLVGCTTPYPTGGYDC
jgi:hypothetical protein